MLVAVSGSQGAGKTTLLNELSNSGYAVIDRKTSRSILSDWNVTLSQVNNDRDLTIKFQEEILSRKYQDELVAMEGDQVFFTERTYVDLFVYALVAIGKDNEYSDWLDRYYDKCMECQKSYQGVFYLNAGYFKPVNDGVRGVNQHYSNMVDLVMSDYTERMTPAENLVFVSSPHIDVRTQIILDAVQIMKTNTGEK